MKTEKRRFTPVTRKKRKTWRQGFGFVMQAPKKPVLMEEKIWKILRDGGCLGLKFRRQEAIQGYVADFYCAELGLVLDLEVPILSPQRDYHALKKLMFGSIGLQEVIIRKEDTTRESLIAKLTPFLKK